MTPSSINRLNAAAITAALAATCVWSMGNAGGKADVNVAAHDNVLEDASGARIPLRRFSRIASGSAVIDRLLVELCEPDRIAAFSEFVPLSYQAYRYAGKPQLPASGDPEAVLALGPDLMIVDNLMLRPGLLRVREAKINVFDLGAMNGMATFLPAIERVGKLVGRPSEAAQLASNFQRTMQGIASAIPAERRKTAIYVGSHAGKLSGGTIGSSFHDVLEAAGLIDVAAKDFRGWPRFVPEQMLSLDPEILVTQKGMTPSLCRDAGLQALRACGPNGRVIEMETPLMLDAGLGMLDAAQMLYTAAYGGT